MRIGNQTFQIGERPYIMGILNITPDSFSDGGSYQTLESAKRRVEQMISEGADLIDIGGESTRPGHQQITEQEEIERILPVIEMVKANYSQPVSVDTYKAKVAEVAVEAGADLINDIWGLRYDSDMARVIAEHKVACCLMHNRKENEYKEFIPDVLSDLQESIQLAEDAGIKRDKIILDPGIGFAKSYEENLMLLKEIRQLNQFGYPLLLGTSRKTVIGLTTNTPANHRVEGTLATAAYAYITGKVAFYRVHDIKEHVQLFQMLQAICEVTS